MFTRVLTRQRPPAEPMAGTFVSLAVHGALVGAVAAGGAGPASPEAPRAAAHAAVGERLHWIGVGVGEGGGIARGRADALPPVAYAIPGRGGAGVRTVTPAVARARAAGGGGGTGGRRAEPARPAAARRRALAPPLPSASDLVLPELEATLLVAGVLAAAPDLAQRVSRPEDFVPRAGAASLTQLLAHAVVGVTEVMEGQNVRVMPIPLVSNRTPAYPAELERAQVGGRVLVEFTIDSTGQVDEGSLRVLQSTHALFTQAVRRALPTLRFVPAQLGEHAVGVTVRQPFLFRLRGGL